MQVSLAAVDTRDDQADMIQHQKLLPNRAILEQVWRGARECLYEPKTGH